eukprot:1194662-Prorocentrum_minimum.AAC.2
MDGRGGDNDTEDPYGTYNDTEDPVLELRVLRLFGAVGAASNVILERFRRWRLESTASTGSSIRLSRDCCHYPPKHVTTPVLKFMAEFVLNKTQRLTFDSSSPNGILLFREVSKLIVAYGSRVLQLGSVGEPYASTYKGIWVVSGPTRSRTVIYRGACRRQRANALMSIRCCVAMPSIESEQRTKAG